MIGNTLGTFIDIDMSFLASDEYVVVQILFHLNLKEGMTGDLEHVLGKNLFSKYRL